MTTESVRVRCRSCGEEFLHFRFHRPSAIERWRSDGTGVVTHTLAHLCRESAYREYYGRDVTELALNAERGGENVKYSR